MDADAKNHESNSPDCNLYESTIMDLPRMIMMEILLRLPIKAIFCSKCVCKTWYTLSSDPSFLKLYPPFPCLLVQFVDDKDDPYSYVSSILELNADYDYNSCPLNRPTLFNSCFPLPKLRLIGSCNGFLCLLEGDTFEENHSIYICNPLLGEYFRVKLHSAGPRVYRLDYGFCFSEVSGQYKVLRSITRGFRPCDCEVPKLEVYTLGDKNWRTWGEAPRPLQDMYGDVNVNGALHWISFGDDMSNNNFEFPILIYSFDIETEHIQSLPFPPGLGDAYEHMTLVELKNCLCLTVSAYKKHIDMWWMKEYGVAESWTKDRILTDCLLPDIRCANFMPKLIWKDGEILMQTCDGTHIVSYNPKENKFRKVDIYTSGSPAVYIDKYTPSFCSLKTILRDSFQVKSVYPQRKKVN